MSIQELPEGFYKYYDELTFLKNNIDNVKDFSDEFCNELMDIIYHLCIDYPREHESYYTLREILSQCSDTRLLTPSIYKLLLLKEQYEVLFEYEKRYDIITSYEYFDVLLYIVNYPVPINFEYFENALLTHKEYFLRSIQENPEKWIIYSNIFYYIQNKEIHRLIYDNIGYSKDVVDHSEYWFKGIFNTVRHVRFLPYIAHYPVLDIGLGYCELGEITILQNFDELHNKFDEIILNTDNNAFDDPIEYLKNSMLTLIHKEKIIKQAKNYYPNPPNSDYSNNREIGMWKLNFMRMLEYNKNLRTIHSIGFKN